MWVRAHFAGSALIPYLSQAPPQSSSFNAWKVSSPPNLESQTDRYHGQADMHHDLDPQKRQFDIAATIAAAHKPSVPQACIKAAAKTATMTESEERVRVAV